jgi:hypothetical protein
MIDIPQLPTDLQESIWKAYCVGLQERYILKYVTPLLDQIHALMPGYANGAHAHLVLDWMAHMLKYPNVKPERGIILVGPPGCGKSLFGCLLTLLLGQENVSRSTALRMARLDGTTLVHIDDCNLHDELENITALLTTQTIAESTSPGQDPRFFPSKHRVLVTSNIFPPLLNHSDAFHERFIFIPCGSVQHPSDFHAAMNDPVKIAAFRKHLMKRPVTA